MRSAIVHLLLLASEVVVALMFAPHRAHSPAHASRVAPEQINLGLRVRVVSVGKTKEEWLQAAIDLYVKRLRAVVEVDCVWVRDDAALLAAVAKCAEPAIVLDERGTQCTSVDFASRMYGALEDGGSRLVRARTALKQHSPRLENCFRRLAPSHHFLTSCVRVCVRVRDAELLHWGCRRPTGGAEGRP